MVVTLQVQQLKPPQKRQPPIIHLINDGMVPHRMRRVLHLLQVVISL